MSRIRFPRSVKAVSTAFNLTAGLVLLALMALTVADVVSRNLQNQSILGTVEISTLLLVAVAFLGLAYAETSGQHVSVNLVEARFGLRSRKVLAGVRTVLLVVTGVLFVWGLGEVLFSAIDRGETTNGILRLATWPAKLVLLLSFLLFFLVAVWKQVLELRAFGSGEVPRTDEVDAAPEQTHSTTHRRDGEGDR